MQQSPHSDEAVLEVTVAAETIKEWLSEQLPPVITSLYERFGVTGLTVNRHNAETDRLLSCRTGKA